MNSDIAIIGVGLYPFGRHPGVSAPEMGVIAANRALADAGLSWREIGTAYTGSLETLMPDTIVKHLGLTGVPVTSLFNGCATGGNLLLNAANAIRSGKADIGIAIGLDKHVPGAFSAGNSMEGIGHEDWYGETGLTLNPQFFAMKTRRYMHDHGITDELLTLSAVKSFKTGALNPDAWRRKAMSFEEIDQSALVCSPLKKYHFCSPSEGAAAVIICRADIAHRYTSTPIYLRAAEFRTRRYGSFDVQSPSFGANNTHSPSTDAAKAAFEAAGIGPKDIDVIQLQDTESGHEIMHLAECGFCNDGEQEQLIREGATEIGGRMPVNTDGGLMCNGEPIGASGLRQVHEVVTQLRGKAGARQIPRDVKTGFTHVYGFPGLSCVTILSR